MACSIYTDEMERIIEYDANYIDYWTLKDIIFEHDIHTIIFYRDDEKKIFDLRRNGRWIDMDDHALCSLCGATHYGVDKNYCSNCGAKMEQNATR